MAIGLVAWAREMGLEVIAAGKILEREMVVDVGGEDGNGDVDSTGNDAGNDRTRGAVLRFKNGVIPLSDEARDLFLPRNVQRASRSSLAQIAAARARHLNDVGRIDNWDLCELAIMCNGTGLPPDVLDAASDHRSNTDNVHCPLAYTTEIPQLLCTLDHGGLLERRGVIDAIRLLRQPHEAGLGGGVFAVVASPSAHVREMMNHKGVVHHPDGHAALLLRPHHLLGVEAIHSIIMAGRARVPTGATTYQPLYDVVYTARRDLKAGECIGDDHSRDLLSKLVPVVRLDRNDPLPAHLASGRVLVAGVSAGAAIRRDDVERAGTSVLWALRERQDRAFAT
jgi:predicted homoserine dehydrogenase-like protein